MEFPLATVDGVIDVLGGTAEVARITGKEAPTVSNWRFRKRIPVDYWPKIVEAAFNRGLPITYATLVEINTASALLGAEPEALDAGDI